MKLSGAAAAASPVAVVVAIVVVAVVVLAIVDVAIFVEVAVCFMRSVSQDLTLSSLAISEGILP